jgi:hypothetical protein
VPAGAIEPQDRYVPDGIDVPVEAWVPVFPVLAQSK